MWIVFHGGHEMMPAQLQAVAGRLQLQCHTLQQCMHGKGQKHTLFLHLHIAKKMHEFAPRHVHIHTDTQTQTQTYTRTHARTQAQTHTHTHTHPYTQTQARTN